MVFDSFQHRFLALLKQKLASTLHSLTTFWFTNLLYTMLLVIYHICQCTTFKLTLQGHLNDQSLRNGESTVFAYALFGSKCSMAIGFGPLLFSPSKDIIFSPRSNTTSTH